MPYGLKKETVEKILNLFSQYNEIDEAILYGSRAKGNYKPGSDIDLCLKGDHLNLHILNKISLDIDDLFLPYTLDLSLYSHIANPDLLSHISRVGQIFYKKGKP